MKKRIAIALLFLCLFSLKMSAQNTSLLSRKITVEFHNTNIESALRLIGREAKVRFAYNAEMFSPDSLVSASFNETELGVVLDDLLGTNFAYREKGNYIIIKSTKEIIAKNEKFVYTITGYVQDANTGEKIPFASIYDSATLSSTLTDANGFYHLDLEQAPGETKNIGISKAQYKDTFILIKPLDNKLLIVNLNKIHDSLTTVPAKDSGKVQLEKNAFVKALTSLRQKMQTKNVQRSFYRPAQVSFLPYLGTNGAMSGQIRNGFSLNIFGGYNGGFTALEMGSLFNIDRDTCTGAQFAGLYNLTAGPYKGAQFAGLVNNHFSHFTGAQFAGLANTCSRGFEGFQAAGLLNINRKSLNGVQAAGLINYSDTIKGAQLSGFINSAGYVKGTQISGFLNVARKIHGTQISFINVADSVDGVQLGFLSFCRNGVHQMEFSYNDAMAYNATFRTGSSALYNIIGASYHPWPNEAFGFTYGLGSRRKLGKKNYMHLNLTGTSFYLGNWNDIPSLYRFSLLYEMRLFKQISIMAGPDINFYYTNGISTQASGYKNPISYIQPMHTFYFNNGRQGQAWVGFHVGLALN